MIIYPRVFCAHFSKIAETYFDNAICARRIPDDK